MKDLLPEDENITLKETELAKLFGNCFGRDVEGLNMIYHVKNAIKIFENHPSIKINKVQH